jgi:hypothetical protein
LLGPCDHVVKTDSQSLLIIYSVFLKKMNTYIRCAIEGT